MKTLIVATAIAMMFSLNLNASPDGTTTKSSAKVHIFQTNTESVDVYVAKTPGELVKISVTSESGTPLIKARVKKQSSRYLRFHMNELPEGNYIVKVEQNGEIISELKVSK